MNKLKVTRDMLLSIYEWLCDNIDERIIPEIETELLPQLERAMQDIETEIERQEQYYKRKEKQIKIILKDCFRIKSRVDKNIIQQAEDRIMEVINV